MNTRIETANDSTCTFCSGPIHPNSLRRDDVCGYCWNSGIRTQPTDQTHLVDRVSFYIVMIGTHKEGTVGHNHPLHLLEAHDAAPPHDDQTVLVELDTLNWVADKIHTLLAEHWVAEAAEA